MDRPLPNIVDRGASGLIGQTIEDCWKENIIAASPAIPFFPPPRSSAHHGRPGPPQASRATRPCRRWKATRTCCAIRPDQIRHRAALEPQPVQSPLAAGIDRPIANQRLQKICRQQVPSRESGKRRDQNQSNSGGSSSWHANQHAPHCRGRRNSMASSRTRTPLRFGMLRNQEPASWLAGGKRMAVVRNRHHGAGAAARPTLRDWRRSVRPTSGGNSFTNAVAVRPDQPTLTTAPRRRDRGRVRHRARSRATCPCSCGGSRPSS
jgi:hypothetical protein